MEALCFGLAVFFGIPAMFTLVVLVAAMSGDVRGIAPMHMHFFPPQRPSPEDRAALARWQDTATALVLAQVGEAPHTLRGTVEGVELTVEGLGDVDTPSQLGCLVKARLPRPLPSGTRIAHIRTPPEHAISLEDPVLDSLIAATARDPAALRARICVDAVRGPLLDVVHAHPRSVVRANAIELRIDREAGDPAPLIRKVVDLANALR